MKLGSQDLKGYGSRMLGCSLRDEVAVDGVVSNHKEIYTFLDVVGGRSSKLLGVALLEVVWANPS